MYNLKMAIIKSRIIYILPINIAVLDEYTQCTFSYVCGCCNRQFGFESRTCSLRDLIVYFGLQIGVDV